MSVSFLSSEDYDRRGAELAETGDFAGAAQIFRDGLAVFPGTPDLRLSLGQAYLALCEYALAAREFQNALVLAPGDLDAQRGLAVAWLRLGHEAEALEMLDRVRDAVPGDEQGCVQLAEALLAAGHPAEALEWATWASDAEPASADGALLRALAWHALGTDPLAKRDAMRQALALDPGRWDSVESCGHICFEDGAYTEARGLFEQLPLAEVENRLTLERLAACHLRVGGSRATRNACRTRLTDLRARDRLDGWPAESAPR